MTEPATPAAPIAAAKHVTQQSTFVRCLRGIWLFTWKTQLTWKRVPLALVSLLVLPVLVYLTTSPRVWERRQPLFGNPNQQFSYFSRDLARAGLPLKPEQFERLRQIFREEFQRIQAEWNEAQNSGTVDNLEIDLVKSEYNRILPRARGVLDDRQSVEFQAIGGRYLQMLQERASQPVWSRRSAFYHWLIDFYFFIVLPLNCVRLSGALIRDELQADTLGFLLTRPLSRAKLVAAKYLSQTAWLQIVLLLETLLLFAVGGLRQIEAIGHLLPLFLATQFLAVFAWSALGLFLGLLTNRYIAMALVYGAIVEMGIGNIPTNINTLSVMRHLKSLLVRNDVVQSIFDWSSRAVPYSVAALLLAAGVFLSLAAVMFTLFEYHHAGEMQK